MWIQSVLHLWTASRKGSAHASAFGYEGEGGESIEQAVVISGTNSDLMGTLAEFQWLQAKFGRKDVDWTLISHSHGSWSEKHYDTVVIRRSTGVEHTIYFDITESFGKCEP